MVAFSYEPSYSSRSLYPFAVAVHRAQLVFLVCPANFCQPREIVTWLILPVVICLSQRLSHACLSTYFYIVKPRMAH